jgi:hypothetical protein
MCGDHDEITTEVRRQRRNPPERFGPRPIGATGRRSLPAVTAHRLHCPRHLLIKRGRTNSLPSSRWCRHRPALRTHVVRPPRETGLACDAHDMSALSINLGEQYDTEVARGPQDPLTPRYRTETLECPQPSRSHPAGPRRGRATARPATFPARTSDADVISSFFSTMMCRSGIRCVGVPRSARDSELGKPSPIKFRQTAMTQ